jgi:uncharacterized membrane protein
MDEASRNLPFRLSNFKGRLAIAVLLAAATFFLTFPLEIVLRIGLAYDLSVAAYLALLLYRVRKIIAEDLKEFYEDREPSSWLAMVGVVAFSSLSMASVGLMLDISKSWSPIQAKLHSALSLLAIVLSSILLHAFYAFYSAHLYSWGGRFDSAAEGPRCHQVD